LADDKIVIPVGNNPVKNAIESESEISTLNSSSEEDAISTLADPNVTVANQTDLQAEIDNATNNVNKTIAISASFDITTAITVTTNKVITIISNAPTNFQLTKTTAGAAFTLSGGGNLTLEDITLNGYASNISALITFDTGGGTFNLNNATIQGNTNTTANQGGAISTSNNADITININEGSRIQNNTAAIKGGAIYTSPNNATNAVILNITGAIFDNNQVAVSGTGNGGGALFLGNFVTTRIDGSSFTDNTTGGAYGGAIYATGASSSFTMTDTIISGNIISGAAISYGGGAYLNAVNTVSISDSTFDNNTVAPTSGSFSAVGGGLGVSGAGTSVSITDTSFTNNTVSGPSNGSGGGLSLATSATTVTLSNLTVTGNEALGAGTNNYGGGIFSSSATLTSINNSTISGNTSGEGGGIHSGSATLTSINNSTISDNTAKMNGGGIFYRGAKDLTITDTTITGNTATGGQGGGICLASNGTADSEYKLTLSGTTKVGDTGAGKRNAAGSYGGGISAGNYVFITMQNGVKVNNNTAGTYGGGISLGTFSRLTTPGYFEINNNTAGTNGGGLYTTTVGFALNMNSGTINGNHAATKGNGSGGGFTISSGNATTPATVTLSGSASVSNNTLGTQIGDAGGSDCYGGGFKTGNFTNIILSDNAVVKNNSAKINGGGINTGNASTIEMTGSAQVNNNAAGTSGGGINMGGYSGTTPVSFTMSGDTQVIGNRSAQTANNGNGGGVQIGNGVAGVNTIVDLSGNAKVSNNYAGYDADGEATGFTGNNGGIGIGTFADVTISGKVQIDGNKATVSGGGISFSTSSDTEIKGGAEIKNNTSGNHGGGIAVLGGNSKLDISGEVAVSGNKTYSNGGGIYVYSSNTVLDISEDVVVSGNTAGQNGGGINISGNGSTLNISDNVHIDSNKATSFGGGILTFADTAVTGDAHIVGNTSDLQGGGIYATGLLTISGGTINNNTTGTNGGGVYVAYADLEKLDVASTVTFANNTAATYALGVTPDDLATYNAHVAKANNTWTKCPATGRSFLRGYNNYDISYAKESSPGVPLPMYAVKFAHDSHGSLTGSVNYPNIYEGTKWVDAGIVAPAPTPSSHYLFDAWSASIPSGTFAITGDLTFTAKFKLDSHTVKFVDYNGNQIGDVQTLIHGTGATAPADPSREGYTFKGWDRSFDNVTENLTVKALYDLIPDERPAIVDPIDDPVIDPVIDPVETYSVSYVGGGENVTGLPAGAAELEQGDMYTVSNTVPTRNGFTFVGWRNGSGNVLRGGDSFRMPARNETLTAQWDSETAVVTTAATTTAGLNTEVVAEPKEPSSAAADKAAVVQAARDAGIPILPGGVPLYAPENFGTWALLDLVLAVLGVVLAAIMLVNYLARKRSEEDLVNDGRLSELGGRKRFRFLVLGFAFAIAGVVIFFLTQDMSLPMVLVDKWTVVLAILFGAEIVFSNRLNRADEDEEEAIAIA
jgi:uncharacterized repeat protein (TIGR02543 family)